MAKMQNLSGRCVLVGLLLVTIAFGVWLAIDDRVSRWFDDYYPAYIAIETARNAACGNFVDGLPGNHFPDGLRADAAFDLQRRERVVFGDRLPVHIHFGRWV